jgi:hypothetical protein
VIDLTGVLDCRAEIIDEVPGIFLSISGEFRLQKQVAESAGAPSVVVAGFVVEAVAVPLWRDSMPLVRC